MYRKFLKQIFDFLITLICLLVLFPIFFIVTIGLSIANSGKPFFTQTRPGKHGKLFKVIKFKTMNDKRDKNGVFSFEEKQNKKEALYMKPLFMESFTSLMFFLPHPRFLVLSDNG